MKSRNLEYCSPNAVLKDSHSANRQPRGLVLPRGRLSVTPGLAGAEGILQPLPQEEFFFYENYHLSASQGGCEGELSLLVENAKK